MPGVLIVEAIAQAAGILIAASIEQPARRVALITSIDGVKLRRPVVPGDQLRLEVVGHRIKAKTACVSGLAKVGDSLAAEAKLRFMLVAADRPVGVDDGAPLATNETARSADNGSPSRPDHPALEFRDSKENQMATLIADTASVDPRASSPTTSRSGRTA